jgi:hypothetical protein
MELKLNSMLLLVSCTHGFYLRTSDVVNALAICTVISTILGEPPLFGSAKAPAHFRDACFAPW